MPENDHVAFIGLGAMGYPMAGHLQGSGRKVTVYNRTAAKAEAWCRQYGGEMASTPAAAVQDASIVFLCVGNDSDVMAVMTGDDGVLSGIKAGATLVDHTTTSRQLAQELAQLTQKQDVAFLDAPVSGGQAGAENGALTVMVGGDDADLKGVQSAINCYSRHTQLMGPVGSRSVNQNGQPALHCWRAGRTRRGLPFRRMRGLGYQGRCQGHSRRCGAIVANE